MAVRTFIRSFDRFMQMRAEEEQVRLIREGRLPSAFRRQTYSCFHEDNKLFDANLYMMDGTINISNVNNDIKSKILASIDRAGARIPYRCEIYPSTESGRSPLFNNFGVKYNNIDNIVEGNPNFRTFNDWFLGWLDGRIIVPDTNIIINHSLRKVILPRILKAINIKIPRFVILELERIGNDRSQYKRRLSFSAFNEIRMLRLNSEAVPFSNPINEEILANFSKVKGERVVDAFIRLEILKGMYRNSIPVERTEQLVLITRDMVMACTASAEDIDTVYLCPAISEQTTFSIANFNSIVTETAISFNEIKLEGLFDDYSVIIEGMWSGKDIVEWGRDRLKFSIIPH